MVEANFSAVTVISSRPVSSEVASEAAAQSTQHIETARLASQSMLAARGRRAETANRSEHLVRADLMDPI
jgi:RecA/RadA recombinase